MTSSTGDSGLILFGSPPRFFIASRIAARSTTQGTPVKSCSTTRAGMKAISVSGSFFASQFATASISFAVTFDAVLVAQQVLQQDLHRIRQALEVEALTEPGQAGKGVALAIDLKGVAYGKGVFHGRAPG